MFLAEPPPTQYDLRFELFGFPVRVHPFFWVLVLFLGSNGTPQQALVWVAAVFISILVHELGHALLQEKFGGHPRIVLYGLGGLSISERLRTSWLQNVIISLAGPFAGFFLWGIVYYAVSHFGTPTNDMLRYFAGDLLFINLVWGILNLMPIYPLDGGQVMREVLTRWMPATTGIVVSLWISIIVAAAIGAYLYVTTGSFYNVLLFAILAYQNYQMLDAYNRSRGRW